MDEKKKVWLEYVGPDQNLKEEFEAVLQAGVRSTDLKQGLVERKEALEAIMVKYAGMLSPSFESRCRAVLLVATAEKFTGKPQPPDKAQFDLGDQDQNMAYFRALGEYEKKLDEYYKLEAALGGSVPKPEEDGVDARMIKMTALLNQLIGSLQGKEIKRIDKGIGRSYLLLDDGVTYPGHKICAVTHEKDIAEFEALAAQCAGAPIDQVRYKILYELPGKRAFEGEKEPEEPAAEPDEAVEEQKQPAAEKETEAPVEEKKEPAAEQKKETTKKAVAKKPVKAAAGKKGDGKKPNEVIPLDEKEKLKKF